MFDFSILFCASRNFFAFISPCYRFALERRGRYSPEPHEDIYGKNLQAAQESETLAALLRIHRQRRWTLASRQSARWDDFRDARKFIYWLVSRVFVSKPFCFEYIAIKTLELKNRERWVKAGVLKRTIWFMPW